MSERFELQLNIILNKDVDLVGSFIKELSDKDNIPTIGEIPEVRLEVLKIAKYKYYSKIGD
jgi:MinD superfamily P-loop ATPase